ncbi:protein takeout-like [Melitaea cinxia]|uniref:protein takeout-like n=1 Tax=Melitaea cinxia TaxID=113334 RepID=UPI001E26F56C|nr:protein takeout-like [Melitaea cinxia]
MIVSSFVLLLCSLLFSDANYVDTLTKCSIKDTPCVINSFMKVLSDVGSTGIPELNILPLDPMNLKNVTITIMDSLELTVTDGIIKGLKNCKVDKISVDLEKQFASQDIVCNEARINGEFYFGGSNPILQNFFGSNSLFGHGKAKIKFEHVTMTLTLPVAVVKKEDGDTYLKILNEKPKYLYDIKKAEFNIKELFIGKNDISKTMSDFLTSNWRSLIPTFGKYFMDKAVELSVEFARRFFDKVPTKVFLLDDLTPYIKK